MQANELIVDVAGGLWQIGSLGYPVAGPASQPERTRGENTAKFRICRDFANAGSMNASAISAGGSSHEHIVPAHNRERVSWVVDRA